MTTGIRTSIWNNNLKSIVLLTLLPLVLIVMVWFTVHALIGENLGEITAGSLQATAAILTLVGIWFLIAYFFSTQLTMNMVHARKVDRLDYPELYNLTENLSIASGITMPKLYIMDTDALNAFASGINANNSAICVTRGLLETLNKAELEGVLAHEMTHILHRDVRLLTIATLFVGIIAFIAEVSVRSIGRGKSSDKKESLFAIILIVAVAAVGYFIAILSKFAISRNREYMADAGAVVLTKDPFSMISALEKISGRSEMEDTPSDVKFMLFDNTQSYLSLFSTHPSIDKRINALKNF